ncbi:hypothetical protein [Pseudomonas umsongensis]|uniref:hypothetical protein n=1 Tax=Pseudomonas umsongensis TaxID=198618 RepID=UPI00200B70AB|nr:hypothetical protein [Pseudomonas umsongensis]MCK8687851.1 hypothetical protein [Pseudomonas umsongensis]
MTAETHDPTQPIQIRREAARTLYITTPMTLAAVAAQVDCSERTAKRWSAADGGWKKAGGPKLTDRAHDIADRMAKAAAELEAALVPAEDRLAAMAEIREDIAADDRGQLLAAHRKQLKVVDGLLNEAVRSRNDAGARLAWRVAQTLAIKQRAERLAWGLDNGEQDHTIVIERS